MKLSRNVTIVSSIVTLIVLLVLGYIISRPRGNVLVDVDFGLDVLTPNADGDSDVTQISYRLRRESIISIYLENADGDRFYFREEQIRPRDEYQVLFSGIVEPYETDEDIQGTVLNRLVPDGKYTWVIEAEEIDTGRVDRIIDTLTIADSDAELPDVWEFTVFPETFTPNQDGINDRVEINLYLAKEANLLVYLIDENGDLIYIPEFQGGRQAGEAGRHSFEYDGGIDNGSNPPPDGTYTVVVLAEDDEGQQVQQTASLTIENGGVPFAEIVGQPTGDTVRFSEETVIIGDILYFELTVENYGDSPIRTTGPEPGYVYDQDELYTSSGYFVESGAWRVGIHCETCLVDYPWRWALGTQDELTPIADAEGNIHYYLMPGERTVITGGIRLTNIVESRNPQNFWAGLIHEDVAIAAVNNRVDPHSIRIVDPDASNTDQ